MVEVGEEEGTEEEDTVTEGVGDTDADGEEVEAGVEEVGRGLSTGILL
jgi:hypothetical protein